MFTIIPAIDLKDGRCVRLKQGVAEAVTVYSGDPVEMARRWEAEGARYLHVVDLDGAFKGVPSHTEVIGRIVKAVKIPVEVGGGLRTDEDIRRLLELGADRAVIGTRAFAEPDDMGRLAKQFGARLAVGIDARDGRVQVKGWVETTELKAIDLAGMLDQAGIRTIICTDTSRDGMMAGVNVSAMDKLCAGVKARVIASGGVTTEEDVKKLVAIRRGNLAGVIVGKALYEGRVTLAGLTAASRGKPSG